MNIGDRVSVEIGPIAHGGHCVARHEGQVIFVRHAIPGERVLVEITEKTSKFLRGNAVEILESSPYRVQPLCTYARWDGCGGCDFQHIKLEYQRELKTQIIKEQFQRIAKKEISCPIEAVEPADGLHWRTRMDFTVSENRKLALFKARSHDVIEIDSCAIADSRMNISEINAQKLPRGSKVDVAISRSGKQSSAIENRENFELIDEGIDQILSISPQSFWQSHISAPRTLIDAVANFSDIQAGDHVFDLYGGVGLFTSDAVKRVGVAGRVTLIELDAQAITDAHRNFAEYETVEIVENSVDRALKKFARADVIILDPPRSGAGKNVVEQIVKLTPRVITYVSCDPASLARDCAYFEERGYRMAAIRAFDLFPMTQHMECVARFIPA
jgi:tRNA/tmRNA/rRNA uracil-C5-methylase (TrmA/RlmC/RlmD family)